MFLVFHRDQVIFESSLSSNSNRPPMASADQQRSAKVVAGVSTSTPLNPIKARLKSFVSPWKNRTLRVIQNLSTPLSNGYQSLICAGWTIIVGVCILEAPCIKSFSYNTILTECRSHKMSIS
ncbi:unnamed protein product [Lactuca virosa]|uniref:Uncharacterized protein n=1 Tax=Lactuca virosa TaxID=75947 RepID=A0AAU9PPH0_9ASTR|nr:unnamed protein product [Lactuca virosa]